MSAGDAWHFQASAPDFGSGPTSEPPPSRQVAAGNARSQRAPLVRPASRRARLQTLG